LAAARFLAGAFFAAFFAAFLAGLLGAVIRVPPRRLSTNWAFVNNKLTMRNVHTSTRHAVYVMRRKPRRERCNIIAFARTKQKSLMR
jgi:hypothetical protein